MTPEERAEYVEQVKAEVKERRRLSWKAHSNKWYAEHKDQVKSNSRKSYLKNKLTNNLRVALWKKKNPASTKNSLLKFKYGVTLKEWDKRFAEQGNRCRICFATEPGGKYSWHTDHDHATGRIRGILCCHCNRMLGGARDNPETLQKAIEYLDCSDSITLPVALGEPGSVSTTKVVSVGSAHGGALNHEKCNPTTPQTWQAGEPGTRVAPLAP